MADQAHAFANWALEDDRVAGIAPWHWDTRKIGVVTPYKEVGVVDMPKTCKKILSLLCLIVFLLLIDL